MIYNLNVTDLQENMDHQGTCFQYADDSNIYKHCKPANLPQCETEMKLILSKLIKWSDDSNLALNPEKTKLTIFPASELAKSHSLHLYETNLVVNDKPLERERST